MLQELEVRAYSLVCGNKARGIRHKLKRDTQAGDKEKNNHCEDNQAVEWAVQRKCEISH